MQRAVLDGEALVESFVASGMSSAHRQLFYEKVRENMRRAGCAMVDASGTATPVVQHTEAARGHIATRMVMAGKLPALRKHMVECN